jgi:uncharacterized paraquat-inducible protein A
MTHFQAQRDAFPAEGEGKSLRSEVRACNACEAEFHPRRPWQRQCSPRCRQRAYVQRQSVIPTGYYGA